MVKAKGGPAAPWRSRITGHGEEAPDQHSGTRRCCEEYSRTYMREYVRRRRAARPDVRAAERANTRDRYWRDPVAVTLIGGVLAGRDDVWCEHGACRCSCGEAFPLPLNLTAIGYDPAFLELQVASVWRPAGLPMVEIAQTDQRMVAGFQALVTLLAQDRFEHDGNPAVARHVRNAVARDALRMRGRRLDRPKSSVRRPIDAATTEVMNAYLTLRPVEPPKPGLSFWFPGEYA